MEQFNKFYSRETVGFYESSLLDFYNTIVSKKVKASARVLDIGPGSKSIFEDTSVDKTLITAIDFSDRALDLAAKNSSINFILGDISKPGDLPNETFDLIFDSHCLHCITDLQNRKSAMTNIYQLMNADGIFAAEMMVQKTKMTVNMPYKHVPDAFDLEKEILDSGFKIEYFMIGRGLSFSNAHGECDVLRVVCRK